MEAKKTKRGKRRWGRELAMQFLYQRNMSSSENYEESLNKFWEMEISGEIEKETKVFAGKLIRGVMENLEEIDAQIVKFSKNWDIKRIAVVDRSILCVAIYEMLYFEEVPPIVSINEALEIAKRYSGEKSKVFINGILDEVKKTLSRSLR